jgi:hypothetical protein
VQFITDGIRSTQAEHPSDTATQKAQNLPDKIQDSEEECRTTENQNADDQQRVGTHNHLSSYVAITRRSAPQ